MSLRTDIARHARTVTGLMASSDTAGAVDRRIWHSWQRCLSRYALDPVAARQPVFIGARELQARRRRTGSLHAVAGPELRTLATLLHAPLGVMLTDRDGVILDYAGDPAFTGIAQRAGFREGAVWSEAEQGTNGMGTCLALGEPVLIAREEHFLHRNTGVSCCAVPLIDAQGQIAGALNVSGYGDLARAPMLALLGVSAQNIENRAFLEQYRRHWLLRFHPQRAAVTTSGEGLLACDEQGVILGCNGAAPRLLGLRHREQLCGQPLEILLGSSLQQLQATAARHPSPWALPELAMHAVLQTPEHPPTIAAKPDRPQSLAGAEKETLRAILDQHGWNVSRVATELRLSRRTVHRKMQRHHLQRGEHR